MKTAIAKSLVLWIIIAAISISLIQYIYGDICSQEKQKTENKIIMLKREFATFKRNRSLAMEKELIAASGENGKGIVRYPDYNISQMLNKLSVYGADRENCKTSVSCENFTEFTLRFTFSKPIDKKVCARIAKKILSDHNQYIHEMLFYKKGDRKLREKDIQFILDRKSIVRLSKNKAIKEKWIVRRIKQI